MTFEADQAERLDKFLARVLPDHSRTKLRRLLDDGLARVDGTVRMPAFRLRPGMRVEVGEIPETPPGDADPIAMELDVVFEDEALLVVNKPRGLAVHPSRSQKAPTLVNALLGRDHSLSRAAGSWRPGIVHRLDKETTGLIVVAKTDTAHFKLARQFAAKTAERRYVAVVKGIPERERWTIEGPIGRDPASPIRMAVVTNGKAAVTHVKRLAHLDEGGLLACRLETGRTHQIRVHLAGVGHPVLGDYLYAPPEYRRGPLQLHAAYLRFVHPITEAEVACFAHPPTDFLGREAVDPGTLDPF